MMKSRPSLRNLARAGLKLLIISSVICGCSSSTTPTYLKENINQAVQDICKKEYKLDVKARLVGETLWVYLPLDKIFEKNEKPEKYTEKFEVEKVSNEFNYGFLDVEYSIKPIAEEEKTEEYKYDKDALQKINNIWLVLRRVILSIDRSKKDEPQFFCIITADINNGFEIKQTIYYLDIKKVSYGLISFGEYYHRSPQDTNLDANIIGDKEGAHLIYKNITMKDFLTEQIRYRIKLKFQKAEVDRGADIDKEIIKVIVYTLKTYNFKDFSGVELNNLLTKNKITLNQAAVWATPME